MAGVIARSSNIGTAMAATQFTPEQLWGYLDKFGLGQRTGIGMPGETRGLLPGTDAWSILTRAQIAFGQGVSVNAVQMASAVNALANGGELVSPEPGRRAGHHRRRTGGRLRDQLPQPGGQRSPPRARPRR